MNLNTPLIIKNHITNKKKKLNKKMVEYLFTILVHVVHQQVFGRYAIAILMLAAQSQDSVWLGVELMRNV